MLVFPLAEPGEIFFQIRTRRTFNRQGAGPVGKKGKTAFPAQGQAINQFGILDKEAGQQGASGK
jgi:hypothetical protein